MRTRPRLLVAAALASAGLLAPLAPLPAQATPQAAPQAAPRAAAASYVALGDSYSSGVGTGSYLADGTACQRSPLAFPSLLAAQAGYVLDFRACSGAMIRDVRGAQLGALSSTTSLVSISVGGNDAGFADVLTECALPAWASDCDTAIDGARGFVASTLPGRLAGLYSSIRAAAPSARVVVVGYPRIFMGEDCDLATFFSPREEARLNSTADRLNGVLAAAAAGSGFSFVDPTAAFTTHAVCDDPEWINGFSIPVSDSYHPNRSGHASGYAPLVAPALGARFVMSPQVRRTALGSADALARDQRAHAARDRRIEPRPFTAPDLHAPALERAARAHGIHLDRWIARHR